MATPEDQLEDGSTIARQLLHCFLGRYFLVRNSAQHGSAERFVEKLWERVKADPGALAATVEALQCCHQTNLDRFQDR